MADKIQLIMDLLDKVEITTVGGGMAFTLLRVNDCEIGASLCDEEGTELVPEVNKKIAERGR